MYWEEYSSNQGHEAPESIEKANELHWNLHITPTLHFAICPGCGSCVNYGMIRLPNLEKWMKVCKTAQQKWDKNEKKKDGTILSFLRPKAAIIPSTVNGPPPVHSYKLVPQSVSNASPASASITAEQRRAISNLMFESVESGPISNSFTKALQYLVKNLPESVSEVYEFERLAMFGEILKELGLQERIGRGCTHENDVILLYLDTCLITLAS